MLNWDELFVKAYICKTLALYNREVMINFLGHISQKQYLFWARVHKLKFA